MITNREWRQIAVGLFHAGFGNDQRGNVLLNLNTALDILRMYAPSGATYDFSTGRLVVSIDQAQNEPEPAPILLDAPVRAPNVAEALEILKSSGSDIGPDTDLVTAAHVVIGDLAGAISGRDFWRAAAESAEQSAQELEARVRAQAQKISEQEANLACAQTALSESKLILESFSLDYDFDERPERTAVVKALDGVNGVLRGIALERVR